MRSLEEGNLEKIAFLIKKLYIYLRFLNKTHMKTNLKNWSQGARKAFTLIELLIVITIIGILAVALLPSVLGAPARARDAARKADMNNIVAALESYNSDKNTYPTDTNVCIDQIAGLNTYFSGGKTPVDPQGKKKDGTAVGSPCLSGYYYNTGDGKPVSYVIASYMEVSGDANIVNTDIPAASIDQTAATLLNTKLKPISGANAYVIIK